MRLYLVRHASAADDDYFPGDFYRTLNKKGYREADEMAQWFAMQHDKPELMISSPAIRAFTTCLLFAERMNYNINKIQLQYNVYDAPSYKLMNVINDIDDRYKKVIMFGHNPGFNDIVNDLCGNIIGDFAKSAVAAIDLDVASWKDVQKNSGSLAYLKDKVVNG